MRVLIQDLRYAARLLRRAPAFTAVAAATLALGIGATIAVFSVVNGVLLRPLPYDHPDRIVALHWSDPPPAPEQSFSAADFVDFRAQSRAFSAIAAERQDIFAMRIHGVPTNVDAWLVSGTFFQVFGAQPIAGRLFTAADEQSGAPLVVLSEALWREQFGADPGVIGRPIELNKKPYTIAGVAPASFAWPAANAKVWVLADHGVPEPPFGDAAADYLTDRGTRYLTVIGRLRPGVTLGAAQAELATIGARLTKLDPEEETGHRASLTSLRDTLVGDVRPVLLILLGAVSLLLLIACINVANLLLARATGRAREIGIRTALGASRGRLVRQLVTESLLLSLAGGAAGLLLAAWLTDALLRFAPHSLPRLQDVHLDPGVAIFAVLVSIATGVLFGSVPAWQVSKAGPVEAMRTGDTRAGSGAGRRTSSVLVVAQVALSLMLLITAGLMARTLTRMLEQDPGFNPARVVAADVFVPQTRYQTQASQQALYSRLLDRLHAQPGAPPAAIVFPLPIASGGEAHGSFTIKGRAPLAPGVKQRAGLNLVSSDFLRVMGIPLVRGRFLTDADGQGSTRGVVINRTMARTYWADSDPIGAQLDLGMSDPGKPPIYFTVVGVVGDVRTNGLIQAPEPQFYLSYRELVLPFMTAVVRTDRGPAAVGSAIRTALAGIDPDLPVEDIRTMPDVIADSVSEPRLRAAVLGAFALLALVLATIGIYGLMSYAVASRTREFGIRLALGATRRDVVSLVLGGGVRLLMAGTVLGLAGAWAATRLLASSLYGVTATDPLTYAALSVLLVAVGAIACYVPARRATAVDPMLALRSE